MKDYVSSSIAELSDFAIMGKDKVRGLTDRREAGVLFGFLALVTLVAATRPDIFFDYDNLSGVALRLLRSVSTYLIMGIGMTYLIIGGEFDLSVGSMFAVGGVSFAILIENQIPSIAAIFIVLALGATVGATNGVIVTKIGVPSLITTIGMLSLLRGIALYITPAGARSVPRDDLVIHLLGGRTELFGLAIPHSAFWAFLLLVVFGLLFKKSRFGYHTYAVGDDAESAKNTGINVDRVKNVNFMLTAALAAFAGIVSISYFGSMFGTAGSGNELLIIAAVVIGGTNLFGGEGSLTGTLLGTLVIGIIPVLLVLNGISVEIERFLTGAIIIIAVILDLIFRRGTIFE